MTSDPFVTLKEAVVKLRRMADMQEATLPLEAMRGLPENQRQFVLGAIALVRMAAATLDQAIEVHRKTFADLGHDIPPPRPTFRAIDGGGSDSDPAA